MLRSIVPVLLLSFSPPPDPAEDLRSIERVFREAKTVEIKFRLQDDVVGPGVEVHRSFSGLFCFASKDRALLTLSEKDAKTIRVVSNGESMERSGIISVSSPRGLSAALPMATARVGIALYAPLSPWSMIQFTDEVSPDPSLTVQDLRFGPEEKDTRTLLYTLKTQPKHPGHRVALTYEPRTFRILKRSLEVGDPRAKITMTEIYDELRLDIELPSDRFRF